jgi:hypothetical protein
MSPTEKLSEEILKMRPDERKELKAKMEETLGKMKSGSSVESSKRKSRVDESFEIYLSLWDRILIFIFSLLGVMSRSEYILRKRLNLIRDRLKNISPPIMNVRTNELYPQFGKYIFEIYQKFRRILELLNMSVFNPNLWDNTNLQYTTCAEYLFEFLTNTRSLFGTLDVKSLLAKKLPVKRLFEQIDTEVEKVVSTLDPALVNKANKVYSKLFVIKELESVDFKRILKYFANERNEISKYCIPDGWFVGELEKLASVLSEIDITPMILDVLTALKKYLGEIVGKDAPEYKSLLEIDPVISSESFEELRDTIENLHLIEVLSLLKKDPDYIPFWVVPDRSLVNVYKEVVKRKSKAYASNVVNSSVKEKQNLFYMFLPEGLESKEKFSNLTIYTEGKNEILSKYQLPQFLYVVPVEIIYVFFDALWKKGFYSSLNDLVVNGIFKDKYLKSTLSNLIISFSELEKDLLDFLKRTGKGGEEYNILNKFFEDPTSLNSENLKRTLQQKISFVNSLAYSLVFKMNDYSGQFNKYLGYVLDDFNSLTPEYVLNIKSIKGIHNPLLKASLSKGKEAFSNIIEILSYFSG